MTTMLTQRAIVAQALTNSEFYLLDGSLQKVDVIQEGYRPDEIIGEILKLDNPRIMVLCIAYEETPATRNTKQTTSYIRCYLEGMLEPTNPGAVDDYIHLMTQMMDVCSGLDNWVRTVPVIDEHNLPYMFHVMREKALFQSIIHPTYLTTNDRRRRP